MRLRTPRLLLRDFEAEDWLAVQEYAADPEAVRYRPFGLCTDKETQAAIQASAEQVHQPERTLNLASVRVLEKIGMRYAEQGPQWIKGELRDILHYAISATEWAKEQE